jgi:signal transduction histidine kinase
MGNAIKYAREAVAPDVRITAAQQENSWHIEVRDNGIEIPEGAEARVFDLFRRAEESHRDLGTGLGLALCQKIVAVREGTIGVRAAPKHGSIF